VLVFRDEIDVPIVVVCDGSVCNDDCVIETALVAAILPV
jgi:hypothetical protein